MVWARSTLLKGVAELVKTKVGDPLHQFESSPDQELATQAALAGQMANYTVERRDIFTPQPIAAVVTKEDLEEISEVFKSLGENLPPFKRRPYPHLPPLEGRDPATGRTTKGVVRNKRSSVQMAATLDEKNRVGNVYDDQNAKVSEEPKTDQDKQILTRDLEKRAKDREAREVAKVAADKKKRDEVAQLEKLKNSSTPS